ncbi:MAG TPA: TldD/PmbA family protein [Casimicrobiaceae bacterium]|nr:TldD/PmbA family protein [Casimicrobiaceae bacterium]
MPDADRLSLDVHCALPPGFAADYWSVRLVEEVSECHAVRKSVALPLQRALDRGAMVTVHAGAGHGYAATSDVSGAGLRAAFERAFAIARACASRSLIDARSLPRPQSRGTYASPGIDAPRRSAREWRELLMQESVAAAIDDRIVDWEASVELREATHRLVTSTGGEVVQRYRLIYPHCAVTAHADGDTQTRTLNGYRGICQQGADEVLARFGFAGCGRRIAEQALELVLAPNCPSGRMQALLMPDQMILQIHESIGHPLELDRILGDERNFAGTSFVTPDMFGTYRYGSPLLNITFDPGRPEELASYGWDDEGTPAEKVYLIRNGVLERPLGSATSQLRAGLPGTANARADNWNRPPIDRMANLNLEPGDATLDEMIAGIEDGILMETNRSWSIDDSRNKFQFGCERGQLIREGGLGAVVKNPNYRGISAVFWRNLARVGNAQTMQVLGTPYCGKGEPSQVIRVGHASPACVFDGVDVFGGVDA